MKRKSTLILFFTLMSILSLSAQKITGTVIDSNTKESLPQAGIKILETDAKFHSGHVTDQDGKFDIQLPMDSFVLQISTMGYAEYSVLIKKNGTQDIKLGIIELEEDTKMLKEVEVTASSVISTINKSIQYPSAIQLKSSNSGLTLLQKMNLEGLHIDPINQSISSNLAANVVYKINGITSNMQQIVALSPEEIERVEYSSIASGRYASEDAAVINIILKKVHTGTYIATDFMAAPTTGFINGMASIRSVYGKSQLSLDYNINWRSYTKPWGNQYTEYRYPTETLLRYSEYDDAPFHYTHQGINLGYAYHDEKNTFSAKFLNTVLTSRNTQNQDIFDNQLISRDIYRSIHVRDNQYTPSADLFYKHSFDKNKGLEFNLVGTQMNTIYDKDLTDTYVKQNDRQELVFQDTDGRKKSAIFEAFYYNKSDNFGYSAGVRGMYSHTKNTYIGDNISRLKQMDAYPYGEIEGKIRNLNYTLSSGVKILQMENFTDSRKYYRNLSTLTLFYKKNNVWNLRYNLRYSPQYPSLGSMADIDQVQDSIMVVRGNPSIKPAQNLFNRLQLTLNHKKLTVYSGAYAQKTFDAIQSDIFYDTQINSMVSHSDNHPYSSSYGGNLQAVVASLFNIFTVTTGGNWDGYKSEINGENYSFNQWRWHLWVDANYKNWTVSGGYRSPYKSMYGQQITLNENSSNFMIMYKKNNLSITAGVLYPFTSGTKYGSQSMSKVAPSKSVRFIRDNRNMVILGVRYNINWGKSIFNINKKIQNADSDRGILN